MNMGNYDGRFLKMEYTIWLSALIVLVTLATPTHSEPRVVCYYTNWSVYRSGTARFNPQNINPYLCTHLVYAFGGFTKDNTLKPFDKYQDIEKGGYAKFTGLKTYNKKLKTLLAIGGWNEGSARFSPMVATKSSRKEFVKNTIRFLRQNHFDGLDLDWEYPAFRDGGKAKDRENYAKLVKELREEFEKESAKTGKSRLLLTMAVPAGIEYIQKGFDVKTLNRYLDWMNLLTYDYHSAFEPAVNHHAPLYPLEEPSEYSVDNELNIDYTIKFYLENGADRDKLVVGIPTYGRSYTLFNPDAVEIGSPADGPGEQGEATKEKGYLAYYEICEALKPKSRRRRAADSEEEESEESEESEEEEEQKPWTVIHPNPAAMGPVAYRGNQWVGYDDIDIVRKKAEYVAQNGLGGIMFWSIDNDDFRGACHDKPYPLIEAAKESYLKGLENTKFIATDAVVKTDSDRRRKNRPRTTTTTTTTTTPKSSKRTSTPSWNAQTPEPPTTPDPGADFKCKDEGFFPHPRDCKKYFWCLDSGPSNLGIVAHQFTCPSGLYFNKAADSCDFARNVLCKVQTTTTKAHKSTTKTTPTTTTSTTTVTTTTRAPVRVSTRNSVLFRTTTTTTPEPEIEDDEEEVEDGDSFDDDAEDPKVIKELIDLIKKVGGVEQLEKQLLLSESSSSTNGAVSTTPTSFNKRLYQKVLDRAIGKNKYTSKTTIETVQQNSRSGPQNAGIEATADKDRLIRKGRPEYVTINRARSSPKTEEPEESEEVEESEEEEVQVSRSKISFGSESASVASTAKPLQYVNIRRAKPTTEATEEAEEPSRSRNALFERSEAFVAVDNLNTIDIINTKRDNIPEYVTIKRNRPSYAETTTIGYSSSELDTSKETELEREISSQVSQPQYTNIVRTRSTTQPPQVQPQTPEPTTILSVQISSLLNEPSEEEEPTTQPQTTLAPEIEKPEPEITTTPTTSPTTTTTSAPSSTTSTTRRSLLRRRGSTSPTTTTTTTEAPESSSQVSSRNYSFIRRRRPLSQPNEISKEVEEPVANNRYRKIRSTTPNSQEVDVSKTLPSRGLNKYRIRVTPSDDSVPAASKVPRQISRFKYEYKDEDISASSEEADDSSIIESYETTDSDDDVDIKRTTIADKITDSDVSATTLETRKPSVLSRGRGRFSLTTESIRKSVSTEAPIAITKRPTFARFSPRPFGRNNNINLDLKPKDTTNTEQVSQRVPSRLPFIRPRIPSTGIGGSLPSRRLPFSSRSTTPRPTTSKNDDEEIDNKNDDITLSESAIEVKEHGQDEQDISIETVTTDSSFTEEITTETNERRKFKIIRRRPTTTSTTTESVTDVTVPRIRKIIRKKIKPSDPDSEVSTKATNFKKEVESSTKQSLNYGERTRVTTHKPTTLEITTTEKEDEEIEIITELLKERTTTTEKYYEKPKEDNKKDVFGDENTSSNEENDNEKDTLDDDNINSQEDNEDEIFSTTSSSLNDKDTNIQEIILQTGNDNLDLSDKQQDLINDRDSTKTSEETTTESYKNEFTTVVPQTDSDEDVTEGPKPSQSEIESKDDVLNKTIIENQDSLSNDTTNIQSADNHTETTTTSTTVLTSPSSRSRSPYKPPKRLFTSTTEAIPSSSRLVFSRKYNPGVYTSPATVERPGFSRATTKKPLIPRTFTRRTFPTPKPTPKYQEEDIVYSDEEILEEEPDNPFVFVPPSKLYTEKPNSEEYEDFEDDEEFIDDLEEPTQEDIPEEEISEEFLEESYPQKPTTSTSKKPLFKPRVINSNTFRTSTTTTELPKRIVGSQQSQQNKTTSFNRFASNKPVDPTKKRVQNVPIGYDPQKTPASNPKNAKVSTTSTTTTTTTTTTESPVSNDSQEQVAITTDSNENDIKTTESDENTSPIDNNEDQSQPLSVNIPMADLSEELTTIAVDTNNKNEDYLESQEVNKELQATENSEDKKEESDLANDSKLSKEVVGQQLSNVETTEAPVVDTTYISYVPPIVKTQFDKLFSVSRIVEVSSKSEKRRLNKNNETTLIQEGKIKIEKKPTLDKIGEVSRYSLIKIVEDEIPIYLTKLGHVYPVDNPPNNPIRIDEARNARALRDIINAPNENLIASESMNEGYRTVNRVAKEANQDTSENIGQSLKDDFLKYVNDDKKSDKSGEDQPYGTQWQFVPAAYENEQNRKTGSRIDSITPRAMQTNPSTLPLESLFKTEMTTKKSNESNAPFVVYSAPISPDAEDASLVKLKILKPQNSRSIVTFAKGKELKGTSHPIHKPISITVLTNDLGNTTSSTTTTTTSTTTERARTSPVIEMLTTTQNTTITTTSTTAKPFEPSSTEAIITEPSVTTETIPEETTTVKISPLDAKRLKYGLARRPLLKPSNVTRYLSRTNSKQNIPTNPKVNKTTSFSPNKTTSFSVNKTASFTPNQRKTSRTQNVPVDIRKRPTANRTRIFTTEAPRSTTERRVSVKPFRSSFRPSFLPRRPTTVATIEGET
ncbi:mucin-5AC [Aricia agestis]|uniref:mucin-5AC n=1 Tax=Aricia agestis TaxID=91739 RepID=UPI001C205F55|nr:mucin-5AC [Aricia agestis]